MILTFFFCIIFLTFVLFLLYFFLLGMARIKWNFEKFLIDRNGQVIDRYSSLTKPEDESLNKKIKKLLEEPKPTATASEPASEPTPTPTA